MSNTQQEQEANQAMQQAVEALTKAAEAAERAGYGSEIRFALSDAHKSAHHALKTALE